MKHLLTLTLFFGLAWGQHLASSNGLELEPMNGFSVTVVDLGEDALSIGLVKKNILSKIKLALRRNNTPPSPVLVYPDLNFKIFVLSNMINNQVVGYNYTIIVSFRRPVVFDSKFIDGYRFGNNENYNLIATVWQVTLGGVSDRRNAKDEIMKYLLDFVDQFSIELLEANAK